VTPSAEPTKVIHGLVDVIAVAIMIRQRAQVIVEPVGVERFNRRSRVLVQQLASFDQQRGIGDSCVSACLNVYSTPAAAGRS
jgi:hypothetical protein